MACRICKRPHTQDFRPFCSKRCADIDLAKWLTDSYVIPGPTADDPQEGDARVEGDDKTA